ncbi:MAG TPA: alpha/beta fold hydrolase, partial [Paludibacter sp.]|nr:alpha/beta fold hydrolase [Paludibacter sp.]
MRNIILSLLIMAIGLSACSTPYAALKEISSFEELDYKYPVKKVYLPENDFTIAYTDEGKGDNAIILIHGLGSYLRAWEKNIGELSKTNRVIAIDLPGYGKSSKEPHSGMMTFYAGIVNELV